MKKYSTIFLNRFFQVQLTLPTSAELGKSVCLLILEEMYTKCMKWNIVIMFISYQQLFYVKQINIPIFNISLSKHKEEKSSWSPGFYVKVWLLVLKRRTYYKNKYKYIHHTGPFIYHVILIRPLLLEPHSLLITCCLRS